MKKRLLCFFLFFAALVLCACAASEPPDASPPEETPCPHAWEDGICALCGEVCSHDAGFAGGSCPRCGLPCPHEWRDGVCALCGFACPHEAHDENAVCLLCGEQRFHSHERGLCTGCGREPLLFDDMLPERYLTPAERRGACLLDSVTGEDGEEHPLAVWLPCDYDENGRYDLLLCIPGDNGDPEGWTETVFSYHGVSFCLSSVYDRMTEEHLCAPFIVVGVEPPKEHASYDDYAALLRETLLPCIVSRYATWAEGDDEASLVAARDHFALCGASRGGHFVIECGVRRCPDLFANFCSMSKGQITKSEVIDFETDLLREYPPRCYVAGWGWNEPDAWTWDKRTFEKIVERLPYLTEGENAFAVPVHDAHNWVTWSTGLFDALQYMF